MKQHLSKKCFTTTELIGVDNAMPHILWTSYFLENQGYSVKTATVYQDNLSAMLLEKNGSWILNGEVEAKHCGMENMVADFFTKPLQGALF
eukprot:10059906-Ditylum_brightwellii.AAC.1